MAEFEIIFTFENDTKMVFVHKSSRLFWNSIVNVKNILTHKHLTVYGLVISQYGNIKSKNLQLTLNFSII